MDNKVMEINKLLVEVYDDIGKIEQESLKQGEFKDLSISEIHTIEAIGMYEEKTMSEVAAKLEITTGTLTTAIDKLIKKGYVERNRNETDRRIVNIRLTKRGKLAYRIHEKFHNDMVKRVIDGFSEHEEEILISGLNKLNDYLKETNEKIKKKC